MSQSEYIQWLVTAPFIKDKNPYREHAMPSIYALCNIDTDIYIFNILRESKIYKPSDIYLVKDIEGNIINQPYKANPTLLIVDKLNGEELYKSLLDEYFLLVHRLIELFREEYLDKYSSKYTFFPKETKRNLGFAALYFLNPYDWSSINTDSKRYELYIRCILYDFKNWSVCKEIIKSHREVIVSLQVELHKYAQDKQ